MAFARPSTRYSAGARSNVANGTGREDALNYLPKADQKRRRGKLQRTYEEPTYEAAKEQLTDLHAELQQISRKAARSLMKGLAEHVLTTVGDPHSPPSLCIWEAGTELEDLGSHREPQ